MTHTEISIVVPVYQVNKYLGTCLDSLLNQNFKYKYNIILVDSNSGDGSDKICDDYEMRYSDKVFHFRYDTYLTVSESRNLGILHSNGKYITFVDGDDCVNDDYLSSLYNCMIENDDIDIVSVNHFIVDKNGKKAKDRFKIRKICISGKEAINELFDQKRYQGYCWGKLFKREFLLHERIFFNPHISMFEDIVFVTDAFYKSKKIGFVKRESYLYIQHENSLMHTNKDLMNSYMKMVFLLKNELKNEKMISILEKRSKAVIKDLLKR